MLRRMRWFSMGVAAGAVAGAGTTMYGYVRWRESRSRLAPDQLSQTVVGAARVVGRRAQQAGRGAQHAGSGVAGAVRDAVAEGRQAMVEASAQIEADLERPTGDHDRRTTPPGGASRGR